MSPIQITNDERIALLRDLVAVPSLSTEEGQASLFLSQWMGDHGYDRSFVDGAGNAVGEIGSEKSPTTIVLLGHIDTVPGQIPVRIEETPDGPILHGRGSVDAKGPLATFAAAAALAAPKFRELGVRVVVVGAVEEEAATSKGARFIRDRFNGEGEPIPRACIIGEPSRWHRVTLGYKGRLLVELKAEREMAHTAGPDPGVAVVGVDFWNVLKSIADDFNVGIEKPFEQLQASLRNIATEADDGFTERVLATAGLRLPIGYDIEPVRERLKAWARDCELSGQSTVRVTDRGYEAAWRSDRNSVLVRSFLGAIREEAKREELPKTVRPGFVVKTGTSDMNVVGPLWQCPILAYGPGDSALDHTPYEHLPLWEYLRAITVLTDALARLATGVSAS